MIKQLLFIHGAGGGAYEEDKKLVSSLRNFLGPSYEIHYPEMENEENAEHETWVRQIRGELSKLNEDVILVGHSIGASTLIKFVTEHQIDNTLDGIFLIATPFWGGDKGWKYEGYETLMLAKEAHRRFPAGVPLFLYHGVNDEVVPFAHLALYEKSFPKAIVRKLEGRDHQLNNTLAEVASDIKALTNEK